MSYLMKMTVVVLAFSVFAAGCSKKSKSARPAAAAAATPAAPAPAPVPAPEEDKPLIDTPPSETPSRFSEGERSRFDNRHYTRTAPPPPPPEPQQAEVQTDGSPADGNPADADWNSHDPRCGTAYAHNSQQWAPGLPNPPSQVKICTGGTDKRLQEGQQFQCEGNPEPVYTDARQDGMMALAVDLVNRLPRHVDNGSRELARRISDVKIEDANGVRVQMKLRISRLRNERIEFRGSRSALRAVNAPGNLKLSAVLTCADADGGCQNAILRVQQLTRTGRISRIAYVVLRSGEAHVTMSEQDRTGFRSQQNQAHAEFAEYLSNTAYNTCSAVLREIVNGERQLPKCAYQRLKAICGRRAQFKRPAAQSFEFNSWAVAYGQAGFLFEMIDREHTRFRVEGPLVAGPQTPVHNKPLHVSGAFGRGIKQAILVANDGGGNLNLQIDFKGDSSTRISVTTLIEDVRYNSEQVMARARQMPALAPHDFVSEREMQDEARARAQRTQPKPVAKPAKGTRPLPRPEGPRFDTPPATPPPPAASGVPPREQEDNQVIQPRDVAPNQT